MDETTSNVDFGGMESEVIASAAKLAEVVMSLGGSVPAVTQITHNCTNTLLLEQFGHVDIGDSKDSYFGLKVQRRGWVPLNEVWLQDKDGHVIRKFSLKPNAADERSESPSHPTTL